MSHLSEKDAGLQLGLKWSWIWSGHHFTTHSSLPGKKWSGNLHGVHGFGLPYSNVSFFLNKSFTYVCLNSNVMLFRSLSMLLRPLEMIEEENEVEDGLDPIEEESEPSTCASSVDQLPTNPDLADQKSKSTLGIDTSNVSRNSIEMSNLKITR